MVIGLVFVVAGTVLVCVGVSYTSMNYDLDTISGLGSLSLLLGVLIFLVGAMKGVAKTIKRQ